MGDLAHCSPQNVEYLDALGAVHAEVGQQEEAVKVLQRAVQLEPDRGFAKYMWALLSLSPQVYDAEHLYIGGVTSAALANTMTLELCRLAAEVCAVTVGTWGSCWRVRRRCMPCREG